MGRGTLKPCILYLLESLCPFLCHIANVVVSCPIWGEGTLNPCMLYLLECLGPFLCHIVNVIMSCPIGGGGRCTCWKSLAHFSATLPMASCLVQYGEGDPKALHIVPVGKLLPISLPHCQCHRALPNMGRGDPKASHIVPAGKPLPISLPHCQCQRVLPNMGRGTLKPRILYLLECLGPFLCHIANVIMSCPIWGGGPCSCWKAFAHFSATLPMSSCPAQYGEGDPKASHIVPVGKPLPISLPHCQCHRVLLFAASG